MDEKRFPIRDEGDIVAVRQSGRSLSESLGFRPTERTLIATAISEIARNILLYAGSGEIAISQENKNGKNAIVVTARDEGPGIADLELAMRDGYSTSSSLGLGLPGSKRLMDEFEIQSAAGKGTTVIMKKWMP